MTSDLRIWAGEPKVVDSSVAFKWFDQAGPGANAAIELLRARQRDEVALVAPTHLPLEVVNALLERGATLADVELGIGFLADVDLLFAPLDQALLVHAASIASKERRMLDDAAFMALAARLDAELVTADPRQASTKACKVRLIR